MVGMAVGIIMGKSPLKGSCGGVGAALNETNYTCDLCEDNQNKCDDLSQYSEKNTTQETGQADIYEVTTKRQ